MSMLITVSNNADAALKIGVAVAAMYAAYRLYTLSNDISEKAKVIGDDVEDFVTETVNPYSKKNFINQSFVGDAIRPVFDGVFDLFIDDGE